APNAIATLRSLASRHDGDMVHGKWHKTNDPIDRIQPEIISPDVAGIQVSKASVLTCVLCACVKLRDCSE
ncbi:hypothetical protein THS27_25265, partial [Thalassospira sp. MCCC 1A01428]